MESSKSTSSPKPRSQPDVSAKHMFLGKSDSTRGLLSECTPLSVLEVKDSSVNSPLPTCHSTVAIAQGNCTAYGGMDALVPSAQPFWTQHSPLQLNCVCIFSPTTGVFYFIQGAEYPPTRSLPHIMGTYSQCHPVPQDWCLVGIRSNKTNKGLSAGTPGWFSAYFRELYHQSPFS